MTHISQPEGYVSIIGTSYLHPIIGLLELLESDNPTGPNEVQASDIENGYSTALIVLSVLFVESTINRTKYIMGIAKPGNPINFVRKHFPSFDAIDKLEELFVVRDVIVHNHIWEAQFYWDEKDGMKLISAKLREEFGDKKYKKVIDPITRSTRLLKINLFPTRICRSDCVIVLQNAIEFLLFLESQDRNYIYLSPQYVKHKGDYVQFMKYINELDPNIITPQIQIIWKKGNIKK